ncbi:SanA/YdcF family protein [Winogradskyella psychrotolerans]|uniref:SanA/YdcF family protein n=1 Tax=Winogradskyella psychrotolerans TaxID=1344585 RepID=UPI001C06E2C1|nr:ElyC/SanA/YdcF family protein [Winogradskyella psychrotolerans]MBU2927300.1 YdcF family protein [Winogradskyella psychrotolerans]
MKTFKILILTGICMVFGVFVTFHWISFKAKGLIYDDMDTIPKNNVGLVLGASKWAPSGNINLFYKHRVDAAVSLYKAGKIDYILVSGDNGRKDYDEPTDFKNDLVANGIPAEHIFLDYAGFRTLDSIVRAKKIFGQNSMTIISQKFHNERAIYIAQHYDIEAIAYNAKDVYKTPPREYLARTKARLDLLFNVKPKFLGDKIAIK